MGLRYDDCAATSPEGLERRILAACARNRIPITFGVVPEIGKGDNHDPVPAGNSPLPQTRKDMLSAARADGVLEIALHGFAHRAARLGVRSEFVGVGAARQSEIIAAGKAELEAFAGPVRTFIPPWNSYDGLTLEELRANGFTTLSAYADGRAAKGGGLRHVPATCLLPELGRAVAAARAAGGGIIVAYFHPYEFKEVDSLRGFFRVAEFESTLTWLAAQGDVQTLTLGQIADRPETDPAVYTGYARWARLAPPFLDKPIRSAFRVYPQAAFPGFAGGLRLRSLVGAWYLFLAAAGFLIAFFSGRWLAKRSSGLSGKKPHPPPGSRRRIPLGPAMTALVGALLGLGGAYCLAFPEASCGAAVLGLGLGIWRWRGPVV